MLGDESNISVEQNIELPALVQQNKLLTTLVGINPDLMNGLDVIHLPSAHEIYNEGDKIDAIYFPVDCVISSLAILEDGTTVEISMVGPEGAVGLSTILGSGATRYWIRTIIEGTVLRLGIEQLEQAFVSDERVMKLLLKSYRSMVTQISQRAVCNARHTLMARFCCWLLMLHDRLGKANLELTQEVIAGRLGSRRAGVTVIARFLLANGAIDYRRGQIYVKDRSILESSACECYPIIRAEFESA